MIKPALQPLTVHYLLRLGRVYMTFALVGVLMLGLVLALRDPLGRTTILLTLVSLASLELVEEWLLYRKLWIRMPERARPEAADLVLCLVVPPDHVQSLLGDLHEIFYSRVMKGSNPLNTRIWYWRQALLGVFAILQWRLRRVMGLSVPDERLLFKKLLRN